MGGSTEPPRTPPGYGSAYVATGWHSPSTELVIVSGKGVACVGKVSPKKKQVLDFMVSTHRMKSSSLSAPAQVFKSLYSAAEAWNWSSTSNLIERSKVKLQTTLLLSVF